MKINGGKGQGSSDARFEPGLAIKCSGATPISSANLGSVALWEGDSLSMRGRMAKEGSIPFRTANFLLHRDKCLGSRMPSTGVAARNNATRRWRGGTY